MSDKKLQASEQANDSGAGQSPGGFYTEPAKSSSAHKPPVWVWFGLGSLLVVALLVIFVLPTVVSEYELPLERRVDVAATTPAAQPDPAEAISPFEEAQRARQRKEAQDILAVLLERQTELEALDVSSWASAAYEQALEQAATGDDYYRNQDFVLAARYYTQAQDQLESLLESTDEVLQQTLAEADSALAAGDSAAARSKYSLARVLDPQSEAAAIGMERSRALDEVLSLFDEAERLAEDGELEQARELYRQIVALDNYNEDARERIDTVTARIREREFGQIMSEGYALLEQREPQQAIAAFERAAGLGVNEAQARAAIEQTENEVANARITRLRARLLTAEASEQWQDAAELYTEVLSIDPNLTFAQEGQDYAGKRAQLDALLEHAIANPERFSDEAVYQETLDVYYTGRNIASPGQRLLNQLDELQGLLETSRIPIEVTFVSDNFTQVTLMREGELGTFEQRTLTLQPGRYVAVGSRPGYREVRKEFVVGFGQTPETVTVQCEERVVSSRR